MDYTSFSNPLYICLFKNTSLTFVSQIIVPANPGVVRLGSGKLFTVNVTGFDSTAHPFFVIFTWTNCPSVGVTVNVLTLLAAPWEALFRKNS